MTAPRVDKQWKDKGLTGYATEEILGTLGHYGVTLDEASFKATAARKFPLELAIDWKPKWKGTGQFAAFPYAAAIELFNRLLPELPAPMKTAQLVLELLANGFKFLAGREDANLTEAFKNWDELVPRLPAKGDRYDAFLDELVTFRESWVQTFNDLPQKLALAGKKDEALRFALVYEVLFTNHEGCMTALVRAQSGEREGAVADLKKWGEDTTRNVFARNSALDALFELEEFEAVKPLGIALFDTAAQEENWGLADSIAHLLSQRLRLTSGILVDYLEN